MNFIRPTKSAGTWKDACAEADENKGGGGGGGGGEEKKEEESEAKGRDGDKEIVRKNEKRVGWSTEKRLKRSIEAE